METPGFAVSRNICDLFWQAKRLNICGGSGSWCQVLGVFFVALRVIEEIKSLCGCRGLTR
jgi:hypothetical protein